jgi:cation:H+ antiporter
MNILRLITDENLLFGFVARLPAVWLTVFMAVCLVVLIKGADWAIDGAVRLARRTRMPRVVIGATIISLGTTTPEMFVSVTAAWMGNSGLALGNGVGSIICDTGLIFGLSCLMTPIPLNRYILDRTGWVQVGAATLLVVVSLASLATGPSPPVLGRGVGFLFLFLLACYLYLSYLWARQDKAVVDEMPEPAGAGLARSAALTAGGLLGVLLGSRLLVPAAAECARRLGVPSDTIAATVVALGTSLPELITAVSAVRKGHPEIMVGNVVGADVLNCLFVIGAAAAARPMTIPPSFYRFHFPAMIIILYSFRFFVFTNRDGWFKRWQGAWILGIYLIYLILQYTFNIGTL